MGFLDILSGRIAKINELSKSHANWISKNLALVPESPEKTYIIYTLDFVGQMMFEYLFHPNLNLLKKHINEMDQDKLITLSGILAIWSLEYNQTHDLRVILNSMDMNKILSGITTVFRTEPNEHENYRQLLNEMNSYNKSEKRVALVYLIIKKTLNWNGNAERDYAIFHTGLMQSLLKSFIEDKAGLFKNYNFDKSKVDIFNYL